MMLLCNSSFSSKSSKRTNRNPVFHLTSTDAPVSYTKKEKHQQISPMSLLSLHDDVSFYITFDYKGPFIFCICWGSQANSIRKPQKNLRNPSTCSKKNLRTSIKDLFFAVFWVLKQTPYVLTHFVHQNDHPKRPEDGPRWDGSSRSPLAWRATSWWW